MYSLAKPELHRLRMKGVKKGQPFVWEHTKTKTKPPARTEFAGTVYKGKVREDRELQTNKACLGLLTCPSFLRSGTSLVGKFERMVTASIAANSGKLTSRG